MNHQHLRAGALTALATAIATVCVAQTGIEAPPRVTAAPPTLVPLDIFTVPEGLEVTVWAQSPMLKNPTNIDIDAQGRIWVTEGVNYRRHKDRDPKGDRVVILEDTDQDGRADRSSVFIQEPTLVAPLGMSVMDNRIVVSNAPDLIVYTDVDRNLKFDAAIDKREVLLTGFDGRNLLVLELGEELHALLRERFPAALVVSGDAADLPQLAANSGFLQAGPGIAAWSPALSNRSATTES